ncbi:MAG: AAA family ATPase [Muribaculaceae bacterium]|nr:AAA family ATPase [Muribaculaceae bacterium]
MLFRKIETSIREYFSSDRDKVLVITGARQVGKSFIIRHVASQMFRNVIEINMVEDADNARLFESVTSTDDFYLRLSIIAGDRMGDRDDTVVFIDEIQQYPHLLTMLKFLRQERRFTYVASGSLLGIALKSSTSIPLGSIEIKQMYPLDFEEFLIANNFGQAAIDIMRVKFEERQPLDQAMHNQVMGLFRRYLLTGGMPDAVNEYLRSRNMVKIREIQRDIMNLYALDASKYDSGRRLNIARIYQMIPSYMESKKKRLVYKDIEGKRGKRSSDYVEEIDYLIASGIALEVKAVSNPSFPLLESGQKNLLKLYLNDVGLLTGALYRNNIMPILDDECSVNLGSVYESVVAQELAAHNHNLFYYDNKTYGEVDYLIDNYASLTAMPVEVKSGKDYTVHSALTRLVSNRDYRIGHACVLANTREVTTDGLITYMPVYYVMFFSGLGSDSTEILL